MVAPMELPQVPSGHSGGCDPNRKCGNGLEKIYQTCAVRYGYMRNIGEFSYAPGVLFGCRSEVIIQTERGIELGEMVSLSCSGCDRSINRDQMRQYAKNCGNDFFRLKAGRIIRVATPADLHEAGKIHEEEEEKLRFARERARERGMAMKIVVCEQLFGGERIVFYFMADERVDFRDLVRDLAHEYHARIDMRQIGHRDEARLVADYEICGRECCCKNFLKTLRPVTMTMAKLQKSTLDPTKVSGRCGRLRCCLRYEHEGYDVLTKKLPRVGNRVRVADGVGTVVDRQVLTQLVMVEFDNGKRVTFAIEDVLERDLPKPPPQPQQPAPGRADGGPRHAGRGRNGGGEGAPRGNEGRPGGGNRGGPQGQPPGGQRQRRDDRPRGGGPRGGPGPEKGGQRRSGPRGDQPPRPAPPPSDEPNPNNTGEAPPSDSAPGEGG